MCNTSQLREIKNDMPQTITIQSCTDNTKAENSAFRVVWYVTKRCVYKSRDQGKYSDWSFLINNLCPFHLILFYAVNF